MNRKEEYIEQMYMANYDDMLRFASTVLNNRDLAQDVVQESFLIAQQKIDKFMASPEPRGWLFNVLKNVIGNAYKRQRLLVKISHELTEEAGAESMEIDIGAKYKGMISDEELQLLIWVYCYGDSYSDVAERLEISLDACKKRIQRAKKRFAKAYEK